MKKIKEWFKRKEKTESKGTYLLDFQTNTCHFFHDCKLKSDDTKEVSGEDWCLKYFKYNACPTCSERNSKALNDCIKWTFMGWVAYVALKEAGKENDPEAVAMVKDSLQHIWDKEHKS